MNINKQDLPQGWFSEEDIATYRELVSNIPDGGTMLELGTWKGRSLCSVADLIIKKNIEVFAVDTFKGTESEGDAHKEAKEIDLRQTFIDNIIRFNIGSRVTTIQGFTDDVVDKFKEKQFDLIFIDADHMEEAVRRDITNYRPKLKESGILAGHDWLWGGIRAAISSLGLSPTTFGNMWYVGKLSRNKKFSICFIGRNEAKTLPRALESLKDFKARGGEICYLDTGSSDNSAQIARDFGCIVGEVGEMFLSTIDDRQAEEINKHFIVDNEAPVVKGGDKLFRFGDARNYCADNLATNDMIAWMDCDEQYTRLDVDKIEDLIEKGYDQFEYNFVFAHGPHGEETVKFVQSKFHNKKKIVWTGIIHEVLSGAGNRMFLDESIIKLEHWQNQETPRGGYLKGLALDCFMHQNADRQSHYFARELLWNGRFKSAIKEFKRHLTISWWNAERAQSMIYIAECLLNLGEEKEAIEWFHKAYQEDGGRREALIKLAYYYYKKSDWLKVAVYCKASLEIPWSGYYATEKPFYENIPHELLAEAYWFLGNREKSREQFDKAFEFCPLSTKLLHDYRFHYGLPKISILIPTLGRPEGLKRCLDSIDKLNYPKEQIEVLTQEDEPRIGVSKRVNELFRKSTGEYVVYAANDMEFEPDCLIIAYIEMLKKDKALCAFHEGPLLPDNGNICTHFMIRSDFVKNELKGEIFSEEFNHVGVDNILWLKAIRKNQAIHSYNAKIIHNHFSKGAPMDKTYETGWKDVENDRKILKKEIYKQFLNEFIENIKKNKNFSFTKIGDGELACIRGDKGANCDGQTYSASLGIELFNAYRSLADLENIFLATQPDEQWRMRDVEQSVFEGNTKNFFDNIYDMLLQRTGEQIEEKKLFYKAIKDSKRKKIFIGNNKLNSVVEMLNIDHFIEVPEHNAYDSIDKICEELYKYISDDCIILLSAGLISKVLMHKALQMNKNITCIDAGSAFDPIFVGITRTNQVSQEELKEFYKELLE